MAEVTHENRTTAYPLIACLGAFCYGETLTMQPVIGERGNGKGYSTRKEFHTLRVPGLPQEWLVLSLIMAFS